MIKNKAKNEGIGTLLDYLDKEIETYYKKNNNHPKLILMSKETKEKLFTEIEKEPTQDNNWYDTKDNYRGIKIKIEENIFIKLE